MSEQDLKEAGLSFTLFLKDGSKRTGVYLDLVVNPLNNTMHKGEQFIKFSTNKPEKDLIVYLPVNDVETIEWST